MPLTAEQRAEINRSNASKSTGPSASGKLRSRFNALKHGLRAKVLALPNEDPAVVEARTEAWNEFYQPKSPAAQHLVNQCVHATLLADRCQQFHAAQLDQQIREAPLLQAKSQLDEIDRLDALLDKDPLRAVGQLRRTAHGCRWLINRWQQLADALEQNGHWQKGHLNSAIHLSGRLPVFWSLDTEIHRLSLYAMLLYPEPPEELKSLLDPTLLSPELAAKVTAEAPPEPEECRRRLLEMVQTKITTLRDTERELRQDFEQPSDAGLLDRSLILADPQAARLFLRYHAESRSAFHRSYSELTRVLKRDAEDAQFDEDVYESLHRDEPTPECDRLSTSVADQPVDSGPVEASLAPEAAPQVKSQPVFVRNSPNEAKSAARDPNLRRYLRDLDMLQCHAAAHADQLAAKIAPKRRRGWR